jgi:hypothetical protein
VDKRTPADGAFPMLHTPTIYVRTFLRNDDLRV